MVSEYRPVSPLPHHVGVSDRKPLGVDAFLAADMSSAFTLSLARIDRLFERSLDFLLPRVSRHLHERQARVDHAEKLARGNRQFLRFGCPPPTVEL